jgi:hypothetical protein
MTAGVYPFLTPPAWTLLVRAEPGRIVTPESAAQIIGPDLAAGAVRELEDRHMLDDDGQFMPVAEAFRRWNRPKVRP